MGNDPGRGLRDLRESGLGGQAWILGVCDDPRRRWERSPARHTPRRGPTSRARANWRSARARGAPFADRRSPIVPSAGPSARRHAPRGSRGSRADHRANRGASSALVADRIRACHHRLRDVGCPGDSAGRGHRNRDSRNAPDLVSRATDGGSASPVRAVRGRNDPLHVHLARPGENPVARASHGRRNRGRLAGPCRISRAGPAERLALGSLRGTSLPEGSASRALGNRADRRLPERPPSSRDPRGHRSPDSYLDRSVPLDRVLAGLAAGPRARFARSVRSRVFRSTRPEPRDRRRSRPTR